MVKLRKSLLANDIDTANDFITELRYSKRLLFNTMQWTFENQTPKHLNKWLPAIYNLLSYIFKESDGLKYLPVRLPKQSTNAVYKLIHYTEQPLHLYHDEWAEYTADVQQYIQSRGGFLIEEDMPKEIRKKLNIVDDDNLRIDLPDEFENECELFDNNLYEAWEYWSNYSIYVYAHNTFPWKLWYNGEPITDVDKQLNSYFDNEKTYLTKSAVNDFPTCLLDTDFPAEELKSLLRLYYNSALTQEAINLSSDISSDIVYNSILDKVKQGVELNREEQNQWHTEAVNRGKAFLIKEGYDFESVEEEQHPVYGEFHRLVVNPSQVIVTAYYRNALGGLLYLNPGLWKNLAEGNSVLIVVYEDGQPRAFTTQEELLNEKYNKYMLYRAFNDKQPETVNPIAEKLKDGTGHLLFVTGPNYYKHLYNILKAQPEDTPINKPLTGLESL